MVVMVMVCVIVVGAGAALGVAFVFAEAPALPRANPMTPVMVGMAHLVRCREPHITHHAVACLKIISTPYPPQRTRDGAYGREARRWRGIRPRR